MLAAGEVHQLELHNLPQLSRFTFTATYPRRTSLQDLPRLTELDLSNRAVSDETLEAVTSLPRLHTLKLTQSALSPKSWRHLRSLQAIRTLELESTGIQGEDLQHLAGLRSLRALTLAGNPIDGKGLAHLRELTNLVSLDLSETHCFDIGLGQHTTHGNLRQSRMFRSTVIPHTGIEHLLALKRLETLYLNGTGAVLEEVVLLGDLPKLDLLHLPANWTEVERAELRKQRPTTRISYARSLDGHRSYYRLMGLMKVANTQNVPTQEQAQVLEQAQRQARSGFRSLTPQPPVRNIVIPSIKLRKN
jgi:hypothetical protein